MAFGSHGGLLIDYLVPTSPSVSALTDTLVPSPGAVSALLDDVVVSYGSTPALTDYAAGDPASKLADGTPAATLYLVVEHFSTHGAAVGVNIGDGQRNPTTVSTVIESTDHTTGAAVGCSIGSTESVSGANVGMNIGTLTQGTGAAVGANIGTGDQNVVPVGMEIEKVTRKLDIEVSIVTEELQEVEEED